MAEAPEAPEAGQFITGDRKNKIHFVTLSSAYRQRIA